MRILFHLMGVPCLIFSHSGERASGGMMYKVVVWARKQFFWSKRYVGSLTYLVCSQSSFSFYVHVVLSQSVTN